MIKKINFGGVSQLAKTIDSGLRRGDMHKLGFG